MKHFYQNIPGYFDFERVYSEQVNRAANKAHFVEVGCWYGKSTAYMAVEIINSGKNIQFDCVDTWEGSPEMKDKKNGAYDPYLAKYGSVYPVFLANMLPVNDHINPIKNTSVEAASTYEDGTLDFVFIDAEHSYEAVKNDVLSWYPKVKEGGILAGHDYYSWPEVAQAVNEIFGSKVKGEGTCWILTKGK